jgi:hypothetical protein
MTDFGGLPFDGIWMEGEYPCSIVRATIVLFDCVLRISALNWSTCEYITLFTMAQPVKNRKEKRFQHVRAQTVKVPW